MREDIAYWVALSRVEGVGARMLRALLDRFGSPEDVLAASPDEWMTVKRLGPTIAERLTTVPETLAAITDELTMLREHDIDVLTWADDGYPANLRTVRDAPPVLYLRGSILPADDFAVAIVGSRECTEDGFHLAQELAAAFADCGITVVSGFALGVDTAAHVGALQGRGRTLAVLGSGIGVISPREHYELAEEITGRGALLSELKPNAPPSGPTLMARDRIISGLSRGVIVIEAAADSGTMDTVDRARKQGRLLWAVDWPSFEANCAGNRVVLKSGGAALPPKLDGNVIDGVVAALQAFALPDDDEDGGTRQMSLF